MTKFKDAYLVPTSGQIEKAAYARWEQRGYSHGSDREDWLAAEWDLTFALNYQSVAHYTLDPTSPVAVGATKPARCRFCEQAPPNAKFLTNGSLIPAFLGQASIVSRDICDDCEQAFRANLEASLQRLWESLPDLISTGEGSARVSLVAFKALTWMALALMPEAQLEFFPDAIEWVSNPDHDDDSSAFTGISCLAYSVPLPASSPWVSLEHRNDDDALLPSLIFFLARGNFILQFPVPMGVLDQESDGEEIRLLRRSWTLAGSLGLGECRVLTPAPTPAPARRASRSWLGG